METPLLSTTHDEVQLRKKLGLKELKSPLGMIKALLSVHLSPIIAALGAFILVAVGCGFGLKYSSAPPMSLTRSSLRDTSLALQLLAIALTVCCLLCFVLTISIDPGAIHPRLTEGKPWPLVQTCTADFSPFADPVALSMTVLHRNHADGNYRYYLDDSDRVLRIELEKDADTDLAFWDKYCVTCRIWRPARAHHCKKCGFCMVRGKSASKAVSRKVFLCL